MCTTNQMQQLSLNVRAKFKYLFNKVVLIYLYNLTQFKTPPIKIVIQFKKEANCFIEVQWWFQQKLKLSI